MHFELEAMKVCLAFIGDVAGGEMIHKAYGMKHNIL